MTFSTAIKTCFAKYFTFSGRASRPEYWWFVLFVFLVSAALTIVDGALFGPDIETVNRTNLGTGESVTFDRASYDGGILGDVFGLATFIPLLSAGWRRMHDTGRSGLYLLYPFIVIIGLGTFAAFAGVTPDSAGWNSLDGIAALILIAGIVVFIISPLLVIWWLTRPSQPGPNAYGPNPHEVTP